MKKIYTPEQKDEAVRMVLAGRKHNQVGELLGIPYSTVSGWMAEYHKEPRSSTKDTGSKQSSWYSKWSPEVKPAYDLIAEISSIKEDMLEIASKLDESIQYLHHWELIEAALVEASNLRIRLDTAIREKKAYEARLVERAMVVHSVD